MEDKKMVKRSIWIGLAVFAAISLLSIISTAAAQSGGEYDLSWWTVDGGGTTSNEGSGYSLGSTIGQPDAAVWFGDDYTLVGGFWGGAVVEYRIYLPLVLKG